MAADVLIIIAEKNFRDEELTNTKEVLEKAGLKVAIASKTVGEKVGRIGTKAHAEIALKDVQTGRYKAIAFIGGQGAENYFNDPEALKIAKEAFKKGKIIAAICIAPVILANSKVLECKPATVWKCAYTLENFKKNNVDYQDEEVVNYRNIITANGPSASKAFAEAIIKAIKEQK